jgi:hypothetical protein
MIKSFLIVSIHFLFIIAAVAQFNKGRIDPARVPAPDHHYQSEYIFDIPADPVLWRNQEPGLKVSFASADVLYLRSEVPVLENETSIWETTGWKGERMNTQILVWSADTVRQVRFRYGDLISASGDRIDAKKIKLYIVRYILSNFFYGATAQNCSSGSADTVYLMPDRLEIMDRFDLPGNSVRPVWLSVDIPRETLPGSYLGSIDVLTDHENFRLDLKINVQNLELPLPGEWKFRLDLWQNPWVVSEYYNLEPWSDKHKLLLKEHLRLYAETGGTFITTYAVHSPWADNSYRLEGGMIEWIKKKDGSWKFDYQIFDEYVDLAMSLGIKEAITIYTPVPWGYRFRYLDESSDIYIYEEWPPESDIFRKMWNIFLDDLKVHLETRGWFEISYLGINENPLDVTLSAIKVIKEHSKEWKITYAGNWHPELSPLVDDYSCIIESEPDVAGLKERKAKGFTTTFYVCCTPARPNNFVFSPPVESRYLGWYTAAFGYDGFLRWAYDAWPADPMRDARHTAWPAGDCYLVYPGGNSSIRFEKLREGIADYEKIKILRGLTRKSGNEKALKSINELESFLSTIIDSPDYFKRNFDSQHLTALLEEGKSLINRISNELPR